MSGTSGKLAHDFKILINHSSPLFIKVAERSSDFKQVPALCSQMQTSITFFLVLQESEYLTDISKNI